MSTKKQSEKPRELIIYRDFISGRTRAVEKNFSWEVELNISKNDGKIHVIEYSAYQDLTAKLQKAEAALEFYAKAPCHEKILEVAPRFREPAIEALKEIRG